MKSNDSRIVYSFGRINYNKSLLLFSPNTPEEIRVLYVSSIAMTMTEEIKILFEHDDDWLWNFTSHGHYSVKSGYNLAIGGENLLPSSSNEVMAAWWRSYLAIQIPKKILHFGWKGFHESLPSFSGLLRRHSTPPRVSTGFTREQSNAETEVLSYKLYVDAAINVIGFGAVIFSSNNQMKAALSKLLQDI
ncbi:hypothetical protein F8388_013775 [Cannabis sativa]|uniref:Reverse transcriptase zinc-binding domain-containing protein n=1 Tax=Cannabis sativa TaxID=3483 RepID=A0A7J6F209_CANSA|nr:hypothetical protein F8388_013775 [Cannabis sativa]